MPHEAATRRFHGTKPGFAWKNELPKSEDQARSQTGTSAVVITEQLEGQDVGVDVARSDIIVLVGLGY